MNKTTPCKKCKKRYRVLSIDKDKGKRDYCAICFKEEFGEWSGTWKGAEEKGGKK